MKWTTHTVALPTRDADKRILYGKLLHISKATTNRFTCEEMEAILIKRGILKQGD